VKQRATEVARSMPSDQSLETAQTLLSAVASCVTPVDQADQKAARAKIATAMGREKRRAARPQK
jgi:hypothetical protein